MSSHPRDPSNPGAPAPSAAVGRRHVLQGIGAAAVTAVAGCGGNGTQGTSTSGGSGFITGAGGASSASSTGAGAGGAGGEGGTGGQGGAGGEGGGEPACPDSGGLSPEELLAPIETIVVLCMENRSFDHYFGSLSLLEGKVTDGLTGAESNPDPDGAPVGIFQLEDTTVADPPHGWGDAHTQWNGGKNDGFVIAHAGDDEKDVMGYHVRGQLPAMYALADAFTLCDRWFSSVMGPTWPNRFYLHGATSKGQKQNLPVFGFKSIFEACEDAGITHKNYYHDVAWCSGAYFKLGGLAKIESFFEDAAAGELPQVVYIDPHFFGNGPNDDHPDHDIAMGQALIASVYAALAQSPQWNEVLLVITYDEHGGFFDHVPPPTTADGDPDFEQLGFRVPAVVAGPYVKSGCVDSTTFEHVSVLRTIQRRFGLAPFNARMEAANDLSSCIDPGALSSPKPPATLPLVKVPVSRVFASRPQRSTHAEIWAAAESGAIPAHLDRRSEGDAIAKRVLEYGVRLGAVKLVP